MGSKKKSSRISRFEFAWLETTKEMCKARVTASFWKKPCSSATDKPDEVRTFIMTVERYVYGLRYDEPGTTIPALTEQEQEILKTAGYSYWYAVNGSLDAPVLWVNI